MFFDRQQAVSLRFDNALVDRLPSNTERLANLSVCWWITVRMLSRKRANYGNHIFIVHFVALFRQ